MSQATVLLSQESYEENLPGSYFYHMKEVTGISQQGFTMGKFFLTNMIIPFKMLHGL